MDIRRKTTYLSRASDGRQSQTYSSFFQSAQRKYYNIDPESGMHLVGPMFELTACVELKGDEDDFDAVYPDSSMSFGPTICSFGLKYNDHNYAMPSGLTPPSMAPHLMDSRHSRGCASSEACFSRAIFAEESATTDRKLSSEFLTSSGSTRSGSYMLQNTTDVSCSVPDNRLSVDLSDGIDGKSRFTGSWYTSRSPEPSPLTERFRDTSSNSPRFGKSSGSYEPIEMRYEPELKVIEVPEELAVSPSQLSDLDSDTDENIQNDKITQIDRPTTQSLVIDGSLINGSIWPKLRCICSRVLAKEQLIQCPNCSLFQHVQCMENHYNVSLPNLADGYICPRCGTEGPTARAPDLSATCANNTQPAQTLQLSNADVLIQVSNEGSEPRLQMDHIKSSITEGAVGAQYVDITVDKARSLGLISGNLKIDNQLSSRSNNIPSYYSGGFGKIGDKNLNKEHENTKTGLHGVDWDRLNELSRCSRRPPGDTNINLRVPSPPRASKRKQDLSSKSYKDVDVNVHDGSPEKRAYSLDVLHSGTPDDSSASVTPLNTPTSTPYKPYSSETPTISRLMTPGSDCSSSSGLDSPLRQQCREKRRNKFGRALFADNQSPDKRALSARSQTLGAAWAKDYQEAESSAYSKALLNHIEQHLSSGVEHNYRIPPTCFSRSSLCRVVLFDHDDKGLEASARLSPNEVVTEVRGNFLLLEEYEHYVDPTTEYNRYVMFYRGFSDRAIVVDTSQYGNNARFVRRSCVPNCRLDHCVVQGKLQLVIRTTSEIMPGTELTLPFDLDYRACRYPLDCACARSRCPVLKWRRKLIRNKVVPNLDYSKYIESQLRALSKPLTHEGPNSMGSAYDPIGLTGSPLIRHTNSSQLPRSTPHISSTISTVNKDMCDYVVEESTLTTPGKSLAPDSDSESVALHSVSSEHRERASLCAPTSDKVSTFEALHSVSPSSTISQAENSTFQPIITTRRQAAAAMRTPVD